MKKFYKSLACLFSIAATILMVIGLILGIVNTKLFDIRPAMWYFSAVNFILFAILFHLAGADWEPEKKP